jgi:hypothetical protein
VNTTFQWSGATYASVSDIKAEYGYAIKREPVTGSTQPYYGTGAFEGKLDITAIGSSDNMMWNAAVATSGIVPTMGMQWQEQDTQGTMSGRIWYASGKVTKYMKKWSKDNYVEYQIKMELTNPPVVS